MGSTFSYYLSSSSQQDMNDYILDNEDRDGDGDRDRDNGYGDSMHVDCQKYYKLYIYIDPLLGQDIKNMYEKNAAAHNLVVDNYLTALYNANNNIGSLSDDEYNQIINDSCFDSGFDLLCPENINQDFLRTLNRITIDYKINCCMKVSNIDRSWGYSGYYLYSRSSTPIKTPLRLANSVGIIDSGYRGNIKAAFDIKSNISFEVERSNRYVQICPPNLEYPMKVFIVDNYDQLGSTKRGSGGFGSTGS